MALTHLVDTSVLTPLAPPEIRAVIQPRVVRSELARAGISDWKSDTQHAVHPNGTDSLARRSSSGSSRQPQDTFGAPSKYNGCLLRSTHAAGRWRTCSSRLPLKPRA